MSYLISVIVTTFNREDALEAVLSALSRQSDQTFEVVIADDGSPAMTAAVVERWRSRLAVPLTHVWQMNCGFRAAEIRNRAILACRGEYCVFLDGDCVAPPDFIATHRKLAQRGWFGACVLGSGSAYAAKLTAWQRFCDCRSGRCAGCGRDNGAARALVTSGFGAAIWSGSTASMPPTPAGVAKIPTC